MKYSLTHILTSLTTPVVATAFFAMAATAPALALAAAPTLSAIEAAPAGLTIEGETAIVSGKIDVRDLISLKEQSQAPVTLDLRQADIEEYMAAKPVYAGRRFFTRNALPAYIFFQAPYNNVLLPENVKTIEAGAFADSQLKSIVIPEGVESIGDYAFYNCPKLEDVVLPSTLRVIGKGAFAKCPMLEEVDMRASAVATLPERCFAESARLCALYLPASLATIGREALTGTAIDNLELQQIKVFAPYALAGMPELQSVSLNPQSSYGEGTLMNCPRLTRIVGAPDNMPSLYAANCLSLDPTDAMSSTSATLGSYAFANNTVSEMVLGKGLTSVGPGAFAGMTALKSIGAESLAADIPAVEPDSFEGIIPSDVLLMVDHKALDAWRSHPVWGQFNVQSRITVKVDEIADSLDSDIRIYVADGYVRVEAAEPIEGAALYSLDGQLLTTMPTGATTSEASLADSSENIIIAVVKTASTRKSAKLIK